MKKILTKLFSASAIILILLILTAIYGYFLEPSRLVIRNKSVQIANWSRELNGFKIVLISDVHAGSNFVTEERLQEITRLANEQNPDLIVLLGDEVSQSRGIGSPLKMPVEKIFANLAGLHAKYGVFTVIGNHDWWFDEQKVIEESRKAGFISLENSSAEIIVNQQIVTIVGFEDFWRKKQITEGIVNVLREIESKTNVIGLAHNPNTFDLISPSVSILLAGHTHGGQVWIPFYGPPVTVAKREYSYGQIEKEGRNLYVTSGIGMSGPNIRLGVPPEIVVLSLYSRE